MILVDANILLYAYDSGSEHHECCRDWVTDAFGGSTPVRLPWASILAFIRIATNSRIFDRPYTVREAVSIVSTWFDAPAVGILEPGERYWEILSAILDDAQVTGPLVSDAALAALALEHGAWLCTSDRDFRRFPTVRVVNPTSG